MCRGSGAGRGALGRAARTAGRAGARTARSIADVATRAPPTALRRAGVRFSAPPAVWRLAVAVLAEPLRAGLPRLGRHRGHIVYLLFLQNLSIAHRMSSSST